MAEERCVGTFALERESKIAEPKERVESTRVLRSDTSASRILPKKRYAVIERLSFEITTLPGFLRPAPGMDDATKRRSSAAAVAATSIVTAITIPVFMGH